jgi:AraC-like DNA-binding protein
MSHGASTCINGLTIASLANTPMRVKIRKANTPMLFIPLFGSGSYHSRGEDIIIRADDRAAFLPSGDYVGESTLRSSIVLFVDPNRLEATIANMLGDKTGGQNILEFDRPQSPALRYGSLSFDKIFRQLTGTIDLLSPQPDLINLSGLDDSIYRAMAMMLKPHLFKLELDVDNTLSYSRKLLDRACQYIQENKHQSITLTDLERVSCMSRRNLHYAFQHQFNCAPMQWVRLQRLETARLMLMKADSTLTVSAIAILCGFSKPSAFSHYYNLRFGELPSATISRIH